MWYTEDGFPSVYLVLRAHWNSQGREWVEVRIPGRPNGRTGWVKRWTLGPWSPETVGDYCAGPNHVLPTLGWARAFGGVGVASFLRRISVQELSADGLRGIGPEAALLARAEQLEAHARAVDLRLARLAGPARSGAAA